MPQSPKKAAYDLEYKKTHQKRIPLELQIADYKIVKAAADAAGESMNGFIKSAIWQRLERDQREAGE